jgi:ArsR family transcriptional regulator
MISPFAGPMSVAAAHELAAALKVIADPARLRIVSLLAAAADGATVAELTERTWLQQPTVSYHLETLARAGLVQREDQPRVGGGWPVTVNRLDRDAFADLAWLLTPPKGSSAVSTDLIDRGEGLLT